MTAEELQEVEALERTYAYGLRPGKKHDPYLKLFVYGIFLDESTRQRYGMVGHRYSTVPDYATFGGGIVRAVRIPGNGLSLTGVVTTPDQTQWDRLDALEGGYDRVEVTTTNGERVYMYVDPEIEDEE